MSKSWDEYAEKARAALEKAIRSGDYCADAFDSLLDRQMRARNRLRKLSYWLDMDDEVFDRMSAQDQADHLWLQGEIKEIRSILAGRDK